MTRPRNKLVKHSLLADIPAELPEELVEILATVDHGRVERIVSRGHASPPDFWYDQDRHEFVLLVQGSAGLAVEGMDQEIVLFPGDYLDIPAHVKHRVNWTERGTDTVWLAVFH